MLRHEIGHNIGMPHVFDDGIKNHPEDWDCLEEGSIMGGNARMEWSPCSVMSFRRLYTRASASNQWCLEGKTNLNSCMYHKFYYLVFTEFHLAINNAKL